MRLVQFVEEGERALGVLSENGVARRVLGITTTYELAMTAIAANHSLEDVIDKAGLDDQPIDIQRALAEKRVLAPIDHPDPAHLLVSGTGLTHLGSAEGRHAMHKQSLDGAATPPLTDSMRMFNLGLEGGRPGVGEIGAQPEWFYKGDGDIVVAPEGVLESPGFAQDGGEEPEIVGIYVIGPTGSPYRLGFALGNEFSDHVTEKYNYLWLAHSKLRQCSFGPELRTGPLPSAVQGISRIHRRNTLVFEKPFLSGEAHMSHSISNLEAHHFKYPGFKRPGDVHVHFFGTATLSFSEGVKTEVGDLFDLTADAFLLPLRNYLSSAPSSFTEVKPL